MNIELRRIRFRPDTIDGQIWIDGEKVCGCAENAHHCLPPGVYSIILAKSRKHARKMPWIIANRGSLIANHSSPMVPSLIAHRSSLIESGNGVYNSTDGSIIVGKYICPGCLSHSRPAFDALYQRIRKNIERGNEVTLTINPLTL